MNRKSVAAFLTCIATSCVSFAAVDLQGGGATFPDPVYQEWIKAFSHVEPDVRLSYTAKGSGFGISSIIDKTLDYAGSDAPMSDAEIAKAKISGGDVVEIPTVAGAVVAVFNIPGFSGDLKLTGSVLADIYLGKITQWNDLAIASQNPGANLPALAITPVHRSDGSGTNFVFTSYLCTQSDDFQQKVSFGKDVKWPGGQGAEKNAGVTQVVQGAPGAIGYVELNYAVANHLPFALLQNESNQYIRASTDTVSAAGDGAVKDMEAQHTLAVRLWDRDGDNAYPIASFTYAIVYKNLDYLGSKEKAQALVDYLWWCTSDDAAKTATSLTYAPLSAGVKAKAQAAISSLTFHGQALQPTTH